MQELFCSAHSTERPSSPPRPEQPTPRLVKTSNLQQQKKLHACAPPLQSNPRILHNLFPSKNEKCEHNRFFAPRRLHNRFLARLITHRHTDTQTNIHTDTTQRHSDKQTHRHTDTQAYIHSRHTDTQPHMSVCVWHESDLSWHQKVHRNKPHNLSPGCMSSVFARRFEREHGARTPGKLILSLFRSTS